MPANILKIGSLTFPATPHARIQSGSLFIQSNFTSFLFLYCLHSHCVMKMRKLVQLSHPYLTILSSREDGVGAGSGEGASRWTKFAIIPDGGQLEKPPSSSRVWSAEWKQGGGRSPLPHCVNLMCIVFRDLESFVLMPCKCVGLGSPEAFPPS